MDMDVVGNKERLLKGILDGETTTDIEPAGNEEHLLYGILKGENESNIEPASRVERLLKAILENGGGGGGTGAVTKQIVGTIANPFSVEEANEIWNAIHGGTGDAHLTFALPSFGSVTARFGAEPYEEGVNVLLASITAPVGNQVAALCLMYLVQEDNLFLAQKLAYAITPSSKPSVMDASALISNNLDTFTALTKYNTQLVLNSLDATYNGTYDAPDGVAYDPVTVDVPQTIVESKTITENGTHTAESGKAFSPVIVAVPVPTLETKSVTANGNYDAPSGKAWNRVEVNVPQMTVSSLSITKNGTHTAPSGTAYSPITVNVEPFSFVVKGSGSFKTWGDIQVDFGETSENYSGDNQTVSFEYNDAKLHRIIITGNLTSIRFANCTALISVDVPFPKTMGSVTYSYYGPCFVGCASLQSIPSGLFDNCVRLRDMSEMFQGCVSLKTIPDGLFAKLTQATNFSWSFYGCSSLAEIPSGLFDNNIGVTTFGNCFRNCTSLGGAAPELWDNTKWTNVTSHDNVFTNCTGLTNYADIPSDWK